MPGLTSWEVFRAARKRFDVRAARLTAFDSSAFWLALLDDLDVMRDFVRERADRALEQERVLDPGLLAHERDTREGYLP